MRGVRLKSSMIERICYDDDEGSLSIWFRATGRYIYYGVPAAAYDAMKTAASAGRYFNDSIKGRYRCAFDPERRRFRPTG